MTKFNPEIHHRKSIRLKDYDYSQAGAYFVTTCTKDRELFFEDKSIKEIVEKYWLEIPKHFEGVELDEYIIMPNHLHGIIVINNVGAVHEPPLINRGSIRELPINRGSIRELPINRGSIRELPLQLKQRRKMLIPQIIGWFKMNSAKEINRLLQRFGQPFWQRNYYEHVIRNEHKLNKIREYIINNPLQWKLDFENPESEKDYKNFTDYLKEKLKQAT